MSATDPLLAPMQGAERRKIGGVQLDIARAGAGRVKRVVYPPGFRWSTHMKPVVGTELCMHGHVGFLSSGRVRGHYGDGCAFDFTAPQVVVLEEPAEGEEAEGEAAEGEEGAEGEAPAGEGEATGDTAPAESSGE